MKKIALKIAYNGISFHGFARQPSVHTVEGEIVKQLINRDIIRDITSAMIRYASRTDKQVSALTNVITFYSDRSTKQILSLISDQFENIFPYGICEVSDSFNPRFAKSRSYQYFLPSHRFSLEKLQDALSLFEGEHDFSNFARIESHRNPVRTIEKIEINHRAEVTLIEIKAQTFLWNQIRRIIEASMRYAKDKISLGQIKLALERPDIKVDFNMAPALPLLLKDISFPNLSFYEPDYLVKNINRVERSVIKHITNLDF